MYILEDLWNGNVTPSVRAVREGSPYHKIRQECGDLIDRLRPQLNREQKKLFDGILDKDTESGELDAQDAFICGFRIGVRMLLDAMGEYDSPLPPFDE